MEIILNGSEKWGILRKSVAFALFAQILSLPLHRGMLHADICSESTHCPACIYSRFAFSKYDENWVQRAPPKGVKEVKTRHDNSLSNLAV